MKKNFLRYSIDNKKLNARLKFNKKFQNNKFSICVKKRLGKISKKDNILDLGCGNGAQTFYFAKKNIEGELYSIDISKESISYLKNKILRKNFFPLCMDMNNISIKKTNFFNIINSCYSFYYARNTKKLFSKCYSLLRENGKLIITTPMPPHFVIDLAKKVHPISKKITNSLIIYKKVIKEMKYKKMKVRIFYFNSNMRVKNYYDLFKFYENSTFYNQKFKLLFLKKIKNMFKNKKVISFKKKTCIIVGTK